MAPRLKVRVGCFRNQSVRFPCFFRRVFVPADLALVERNPELSAKSLINRQLALGKRVFEIRLWPYTKVPIQTVRL
jgi:hypothetical protein